MTISWVEYTHSTEVASQNTNHNQVVQLYQPKSYDYALKYLAEAPAVLIINLLLSVGTQLFTSSIAVNLWAIHKSVTISLGKKNDSLGSKSLSKSMLCDGVQQRQYSLFTIIITVPVVWNMFLLPWCTFKTQGYQLLTLQPVHNFCYMYLSLSIISYLYLVIWWCYSLVVFEVCVC